MNFNKEIFKIQTFISKWDEIKKAFKTKEAEMNVSGAGGDRTLMFHKFINKFFYYIQFRLGSISLGKESYEKLYAMLHGQMPTGFYIITLSSNQLMLIGETAKSANKCLIDITSLNNTTNYTNDSNSLNNSFTSIGSIIDIEGPNNINESIKNEKKPIMKRSHHAIKSEKISNQNILIDMSENIKETTSLIRKRVESKTEIENARKSLKLIIETQNDNYYPFLNLLKHPDNAIMFNLCESNEEKLGYLKYLNTTTDKQI